MCVTLSSTMPLQERVPVKNTHKRASYLVILSLLVSLLYYRLSSLHHRGLLWLVALLCESWFTFVWLLVLNVKWNPVKYRTDPESISKRCEDLPAVDIFVTTADPKLEPPIMTANTVLSLLAMEYPAGKLACYVSDDACSPLTYYALVEAAEFARSWVPFCKKFDIRVRAPFAYLSSGEREASCLPSSDFMRDWEVMNNKYEGLVRNIEEAAQARTPFHYLREEVAHLFRFERGNHPSIVKVIWENKDGLADGIPHLIYVAREKSPRHPHHYKAGAMNVLTRVSGVMTNAPIMLNVDCDMLVNNAEVILHAMCLLLGFDNDRMSGFVQCLQVFHSALKDDPFGNQLVVLQQISLLGMEGLQGPVYQGTGCFHRRKVIYGEEPKIEGDQETRGELSPQELQRRFGSSRELQESAAEVIRGVLKTTLAVGDLTARVAAATQVASCSYELNTCWGTREVGWVYGSTTEDVQTGLRIHAMGWRSVSLRLDPAPFVGTAPVGGPESMTQYKRWATGLLEILVGKNGPLLATVTGKLGFRQCLAYINVWALQSAPELTYSLLAPYCALANVSFLPKVSEPMVVVPAALFVSYNVYTMAEYVECGLSIRAWWNNQRMTRILSATAWLFGLFGVILKLLGVSETTFQVTQKDQNTSPSSTGGGGGEDPGRFTFDASPLFVPGAVVLLLNLAAFPVILMGMLGSPAGFASDDDGPGIGELVCSGWAVLSFWPFLRGLYGKGSYGLPWPTIAKASIIAVPFSLWCKWAS